MTKDELTAHVEAAKRARHRRRCPHCGGYDAGGLILSCSGCGRQGTVDDQLADSVLALAKEVERLQAQVADYQNEIASHGREVVRLTAELAARDLEVITSHLASAKRVEELEKALKPFAERADGIPAEVDGDCVWGTDLIPVGAYREARRLLEQPQ